MIKNEKIAKMIFASGCFCYNGKKEFVLDSKTMSHIYFDINILASFPFFRKEIIIELSKMAGLLDDGGGKTYLAAAGHSGITFAAFISEIIELPMVYIRDSAKKHGKKNMVEGSLKEAKSGIIFTDLLSSDAKVENSIKALEEAGCLVKGVLTVLNMTEMDSIKSSSGKEIPVQSCVTLKELCCYGEKEKLFSKEVLNLLKSGVGETLQKTDDFNETVPNEQEAAQILLDVGSVALSVTEPFRYASGILSPIYCDNRLLISSTDKWNLIISSIEKIIRDKIGLENIEVIAGTSTAGVPHAGKLALRLGLPVVYVKSENGETGRKSIVEGAFYYGKRVLVIEDLVSTGKSSVAAIKAVREQGGIVENTVAIFSYQMKSAEKAFAEENCALYTVSNFSALIKQALDKKYITGEDGEKAKSWNSDPENWGKKHGYE